MVWLLGIVGLSVLKMDRFLNRFSRIGFVLVKTSRKTVGHLQVWVTDILLCNRMRSNVLQHIGKQYSTWNIAAAG